MKRAGWLFLQVWANAIAHEGACQQQPARFRRPARLFATIGFQPAQIFSKLSRHVDLNCIHHPLDLNCVIGFPRNQFVACPLELARLSFSFNPEPTATFSILVARVVMAVAAA
jgi:hypothetical protein